MGQKKVIIIRKVRIREKQKNKRTKIGYPRKKYSKKMEKQNTFEREKKQ